MAVKEGDYFNDKVGFIELVRCPIGQEFCVSHLREVNKFVQHSRGNWISKDYHKAIEDLKAAFDQTMDINPEQCARCTKLFRETLIRSMESIHNDLRQMTSGLFRAKRHQSSFEEVSRILQEMKDRHQSM